MTRAGAFTCSQGAGYGQLDLTGRAPKVRREQRELPGGSGPSPVPAQREVPPGGFGGHPIPAGIAFEALLPAASQYHAGCGAPAGGADWNMEIVGVAEAA